MDKKKKKNKNKDNLDKVVSNSDNFTGEAGQNTERDYALEGEYWGGVTQDTVSEKIEFASGETEKNLQFRIRGDNKYDGTRAVVWTTSPNSSFGFDKEFYIFNEAIAGDPNSNLESSDDPAERWINSEPLDIKLQLNSPIKAVTIIIEEDQLPDRIIKGTEGVDVLQVPSSELIDAQNRVPAYQYGYAVYGYAGNDTLRGADGIDDLFGWAGNDSLHGGGSSDYLSGNSGNDALYGEDIDVDNILNVGGDLLDGGDGNDFAFGGPGVDKLFGGAGDDILWGGKASDQSSDLLYGEYGEDRLYGGGGKDALFGGLGKDRFEFYNPNIDGWDYIADFENQDRIGVYVGKEIKQAQFFRKSDLSFRKNGRLSSKHFASFNVEKQRDVKANDSDERFLYNQASGMLYFDRDGKGHIFQKQLMAILAEPIIPKEPGWQEPEQTSEVILDPDLTNQQFPTLKAKHIVAFGDEVWRNSPLFNSRLTIFDVSESLY
jgi:hypothetical protein